jgi:hypothetical protein
LSRLAHEMVRAALVIVGNDETPGRHAPLRDGQHVAGESAFVASQSGGGRPAPLDQGAEQPNSELNKDILEGFYQKPKAWANWPGEKISRSGLPSSIFTALRARHRTG